MHQQPTLIDIFSGAGGVTQGFKKAGFKALAAIEYDSIIAQTYEANHKGVKVFDKDVRDVSPEEVMKACKIQPGDLTVLSVCAPCQPFSRQTRLTRKDDRTELVLHMVRFMEALRPRFAIMENVPGLAKGKNKPILDKLIESLRNLGYSVKEPQIVNAADYGVPQFRKRLILLCSRENTPLMFPSGTHVNPLVANYLRKKPWRTVKEAFKKLSPLASGEKHKTDPLHRARVHRELNLERLKHIPHNGGSRNSLPQNLQLNCHKKGTGFNDVYGRMHLDRPANTLTTGCTNFTKGRFAHPTEDRAITPREAARLQTFPDNYQFVGTYEQISAQIGNAVPVDLAKAFAKYFYQLWKKESLR